MDTLKIVVLSQEGIALIGLTWKNIEMGELELIYLAAKVMSLFYQFSCNA